MLQAEVEAIFGPPGDRRTGETETDPTDMAEERDVFGQVGSGGSSQWWLSDTGDMLVGFDVSGRVRTPPTTPTPPH
jgi:hypothetical protein